MPKTPAQSAADDALEDAVKKVVEAYDLIPGGSMITDYLVIGEAMQFLDDGDSTCNMFLEFRNGNVRLTTALGIMDLGRRQMMAQWEHESE